MAEKTILKGIRLDSPLTINVCVSIVLSGRSDTCCPLVGTVLEELCMAFIVTS